MHTTKRDLTDSRPQVAPDAVGVVLAAGAATRFGSPKQLAPLSGRPLVAWAIHALREGGLDQVLVVLGAHHELIAPEVQAEAEIVLADPEYTEGMSASLRMGTAAAERLGAHRVVVVLGDQPFLSGQAVGRVLAASRAGASIARATYGGLPGHPTALASATFPQVAKLRGDAGARMLRGFEVVDVPCDGLGSTVDVDRPEDLARLACQPLV